MITRRGARLLASVFVAGLVLVGCGDDDGDADNGVEELSADEILERARTAATEAGSVRIAGEVSQDNESFALDMRVGADGATGTITAQGATLEMLRVGEDHYLKATADAWETLTGEAAAGQLLADKYVKVPGDDESLGIGTFLLNFDQLLDEMLSPDGELEKGETSEINGTRVIGLVDNSEDGGTLFVALTGEPYPLRIAAPEGSGEGAIDFLEWGESVEVSAPAEDQVVDFSELQ